MALLVIWLPKCILRVLVSATIVSANSSGRLVAGDYFETLSTQYGTLTAIIYFSHSPASRKLWVNLLKRNFSCFYNSDRDASEVNFPDDEQLTSDDNIEDALVIRAMVDGETTTLRESLMIPARSSVRESSTTTTTSTTNVIIQLAVQ